MSTRYIRETVIKDIIDLLGAIKDGDEKIIDKLTPKNSKYATSISKSSKDLIMTFPVICSNTIDPKTATMVSKAIERKCVTMLQLLFSSIAISDVENVADFIKDFHSNINIGNLSVDDYLDIADKVYKDVKPLIGESALIRSVQEDMKNLPNERVLSNSVNETSLQNFKIVDNYGEIMVMTEEEHPLKTSTDIQKSLSQMKKDEYERFNKQLLDTDVKKCNEMVPSLLIVNLNIRGENGANSSKTSAVVGVKARLIPTDSFDIIDRVYAKHNDSNTLLKLVRATTREISFCKDFLFGIDKAKIDVLSKSKKGSASSLWKTLERRSIKSNINKALRKQNNAMSITSLVVTQDEADFLYKNYNIKLEHIPTARNLLAKYNLLSLVIVDETIEVCKFLFDGEDSFETLSFNNLERESGDGMYKKVLNLMTKMNR